MSSSTRRRVERWSPAVTGDAAFDGLTEPPTPRYGRRKLLHTLSSTPLYPHFNVGCALTHNLQHVSSSPLRLQSSKPTLRWGYKGIQCWYYAEYFPPTVPHHHGIELVLVFLAVQVVKTFWLNESNRWLLLLIVFSRLVILRSEGCLNSTLLQHSWNPLIDVIVSLKLLPGGGGV